MTEEDEIVTETDGTDGTDTAGEPVESESVDEIDGTEKPSEPVETVDETAEAVPDGKKKERKKRLKDAVLLWTLDTDDDGDYTLDGVHIERADLPRDAVHVVGTKGMFGQGNKQFLVLGDGVDPPMPVHVQEDGMFALTATDLYLFCVNNDIRDEFNIKQTARFGNLDTRKIMIWLCVAVVAVCVIYAMI